MNQGFNFSPPFTPAFGMYSDRLWNQENRYTVPQFGPYPDMMQKFWEYSPGEKLFNHPNRFRRIPTWNDPYYRIPKAAMSEHRKYDV
jgi:hypothetical protein